MPFFQVSKTSAFHNRQGLQLSSSSLKPKKQLSRMRTWVILGDVWGNMHRMHPVSSSIMEKPSRSSP